MCFLSALYKLSSPFLTLTLTLRTWKVLYSACDCVLLKYTFYFVVLRVNYDRHSLAMHEARYIVNFFFVLVTCGEVRKSVVLAAGDEM